MKNNISEIRDNKDLNHKSLSIIVRDDTVYIHTSVFPFGETFRDTISIVTTSSRLKKLALEILETLNAKTKIKEWTPTFGDLEAQLDKNGVSYGLEYWFIWRKNS